MGWIIAGTYALCVLITMRTVASLIYWLMGSLHIEDAWIIVPAGVVWPASAVAGLLYLTVRYMLWPLVKPEAMRRAEREAKQQWAAQAAQNLAQTYRLPYPPGIDIPSSGR